MEMARFCANISHHGGCRRTMAQSSTLESLVLLLDHSDSIIVTAVCGALINFTADGKAQKNTLYSLLLPCCMGSYAHKSGTYKKNLLAGTILEALTAAGASTKLAEALLLASNSQLEYDGAIDLANTCSKALLNLIYQSVDNGDFK